MILYDAGPYGIGRSLWRLPGCVFPRASLLAFIPSIMTLIVASIVQAEANRELVEEAIPSDTLLRLHATFTWVFGFVLVFRTGVAWNRYWEGAQQLKVMAAEWYDACAGIVNFIQVTDKRNEEKRAYQGSCVRLFSLLHCLALQKITVCQDESFDVVDLEGLDPELLKGLRSLDDAMEKTEVVFQWIHRLIVEGVKQGYIATPPPIVTRCFQELNSGMLALCTMAAITDIQFPFPYAQMISSLLILQGLMTPILLGTANVHPVFAFIFAFISLFALCSLNLIACEIEQPFGDDYNDLDCRESQRSMNCSLLLLLDPLTQAMPNIDPVRATQMKRLTARGEIIAEKEGDCDHSLQVEQARLYKSSESGSNRSKSLSNLTKGMQLDKSVSKSQVLIERSKDPRDARFPDSQPEPENPNSKGPMSPPMSPHSSNNSSILKKPAIHVDLVKPDISTTPGASAPLPPPDHTPLSHGLEECARRIEELLGQSYLRMCAVQDAMAQLVRLSTETGTNTYQLYQLALKPGIIVRPPAAESFSSDFRPEDMSNAGPKSGALCSFDMPCRQQRPELPEVHRR